MCYVHTGAEGLHRSQAVNRAPTSILQTTQPVVVYAYLHSVRWPSDSVVAYHLAQCHAEAVQAASSQEQCMLLPTLFIMCMLMQASVDTLREQVRLLRSQRQRAVVLAHLPALRPEAHTHMQPKGPSQGCAALDVARRLQLEPAQTPKVGSTPGYVPGHTWPDVLLCTACVKGMQSKLTLIRATVGNTCCRTAGYVQKTHLSCCTP